MKYILSVVLVLLNIINIPINKLFIITQKWYLPMWKKDKVIYFAFAPFYWILVIFTFAIGYPCEKLAQFVH